MGRRESRRRGLGHDPVPVPDHALLFEAGAAGRIPDLVAGFGARKILPVTDEGVRAAGPTRAAEAALAAICRDCGVPAPLSAVGTA